MKDYFNTLGVAPDASDEDIKRAYKRLAMKHHPDRGGDQSEFQAIQEAYSTLSDPHKRQQWEQQRQFGGAHNQEGFHFNFGFGQDINDIIRQFHGGGPFGGFRQQPARNRDLRVGIEFDLESTLSDQIHHINVQHTNGQNKTVEIKIPRGVQSGMQMRYAGHGDSAIPNVTAGDLYVDFRVRQHLDFRIHGINLSKTVTLNCIDAIIGTTLQVTGIDGKLFEISIPPVTQHDSKFRIAGQGLWDINQPVRGDLLVHILLQVPSAPTAEQLERLQQLKS
jgi:curved DNA-binding protein